MQFIANLVKYNLSNYGPFNTPLQTTKWFRNIKFIKVLVRQRNLALVHVSHHTPLLANIALSFVSSLVISLNIRIFKKVIKGTASYFYSHILKKILVNQVAMVWDDKHFFKRFFLKRPQFTCTYVSCVFIYKFTRLGLPKA